MRPVAAAATSPETRWARSASLRTRRRSIPRIAAGRFVKALARTATQEDDGIVIEAMTGSPRDAAREHRRAGPPPPRHKAKPYRGAGGKRR